MIQLPVNNLNQTNHLLFSRNKALVYHFSVIYIFPPFPFEEFSTTLKNNKLLFNFLEISGTRIILNRTTSNFVKSSQYNLEYTPKHQWRYITVHRKNTKIERTSIYLNPKNLNHYSQNEIKTIKTLQQDAFTNILLWYYLLPTS